MNDVREKIHVKLEAVRPAFRHIEVAEIKKDGKTDWAIFRVPVMPGDKTGAVQILDKRAETVAAAKEVCNLPKRTRHETLRLTNNKALECLNQGCVDVDILEREMVGGGVSVILHNNPNAPAQGALTAIMVKSHYSCYSKDALAFPALSKSRLETQADGERQRQFYHLLLVVAENGREIEIWQTDNETPSRFVFAANGQMSQTDYVCKDEPRVTTPANPTSTPESKPIRLLEKSRDMPVADSGDGFDTSIGNIANGKEKLSTLKK